MSVHHRIKLRHLRTFVEIARHGALKPAAETLNMTQPAVSKVLKDLEDIVGFHLVNRSRRGASLTEAGEVFLQFAEQSLISLQQGLTSLKAIESGTVGQLRIGALPSVAARLLPIAAMRFRELSPGATLSIEEGSHETLVARLRSGELDVVVGRLGSSESMTGLSFTQIYSEQVVIVTAPDHPIAGSNRIEDVFDWPVLYPPAAAAIRPLVDRLFLSLGVGQPPDRIETVSEAFGRALVQGPLQAVWIISGGVVASELASGTLVPLAIDAGETAGPVGIMARSDEDTLPIARLFRTAISKALNEISIE
jgi:LysR family pca operon transcriptional activator